MALSLSVSIPSPFPLKLHIATTSNHLSYLTFNSHHYWFFAPSYPYKNNLKAWTFFFIIFFLSNLYYINSRSFKLLILLNQRIDFTDRNKICCKKKKISIDLFIQLFINWIELNWIRVKRSEIDVYHRYDDESERKTDRSIFFLL